MESSIFNFLVSYIPTDKRHPQEDYLTQLFAWLLSNVNGFSNNYVHFLLDKIKLNPHFDVDYFDYNIEIETQKSVPSGFIDMVIRVPDKAVFVCEHKVHSSLSPNQINKYMNDISKKETLPYYSVLLTLNTSQHKQEPDIAITWNDIYKFTTNLLNENDYKQPDLFLLKHFIVYLEENGMGNADMMSTKAISEYFEMKTFEENLAKLLAATANHNWEEAVPKLKEVFKQDVTPIFKKKRWGRCGIDLFKEWKPGVFLGVILDTEDHQLEPRDKSKGPDFVVIVDGDWSNREIYDSIITSDWYKKKLVALEKKHGNFQDFIGRPKNNWRIFILRKPLFDVLKDANTAEEQEQALISAMEEGLRLLAE